MRDYCGNNTSDRRIYCRILRSVRAPCFRLRQQFAVGDHAGGFADAEVGVGEGVGLAEGAHGDVVRGPGADAWESGEAGD
jgi:hypothetical protein